MSEHCSICGDGGPPKLSLVKNGLGKLIATSKLRKDGLYKEFAESVTTFVHPICRKNYTNPKFIERDRKRLEEDRGKYALRTPPTERFDFKTKCLTCGKCVPTDEMRTKHPDRDPVSVVATLAMHDSLSKAASNRQDSWGGDVLRRINSVFDLVAAEGRYHRRCHVMFCNPRVSLSSQTTVGRAKDPAKQNAFEKLCKFLEEAEDCQFDLKELVQTVTKLSPLTEPYSDIHLLRLLRDRYKDQIFIAPQQGLKTVLCFKGTAQRVLNQRWYKEQRAADPQEERLRIVETAAQIVREDIRSMAYDTTKFPSPMQIAAGGQELVPQTLQTFVETVACSGKRGEQQNLRKKCLALEHSLIAMTRPRSFISPVHFGLVVLLHKEFGSRYLIDVMNSMGHCCSYNEVSNYESVVALKIETNVDPMGFMQWVFDNFDFNVNTLDGHNTIHCMGGIKVVTPAGAVSTPSDVPRGKIQVTSQEQFRRVAEIPIQFRGQGRNGDGLMSLKVTLFEPMPGTTACLEYSHSLDALWLAASWVTEGSPFPGWNGFNTAATSKNENYERSAIIPTPFVNLQPSNPTTIYTCLKYAAEESAKRNQSHCVVTFDQPLFYKAVTIALEEPSLSSVILRLGGFHTLMSYLGAVGFIFAGSGIEFIWETLYAKNTVNHLLSGHVFSRSLRAHFLTHQALAHILLDTLPADSIPSHEVRDAAMKLMAGEINCNDAVNLPCVQRATVALENAMQNAKKTRTGRLWISYMRMVQVIRNFIRAERSGLWQLHIQCVEQMVPLFFASGHLHYAKSSLLYLHNMSNLEEKMNVTDYEKFTKGGFFTIRRSSKFWGGIWSDMTIEQSLMRKLKARGGLTGGRGTGAGAVAKFLQTATATFPVIEAVETFCGVRAETSEQHKELRDSRMKRDRRDLEKVFSWISRHSPFETGRDDALVSLSTGAIADESVNCDQALELGLAAMQRATGTPFGTHRVRRSDRVRSLASVSLTLKSKSKGETIQVNPNQLFHRLVCALHKKQNLAILPSCFSFEMAVRPPALFNQEFMRHGNKSSFVDVLVKYAAPSQRIPDQPVFTIDAGFLLHKVTWPSPATYSQVCGVYEGYVSSFGYNGPTTKDEMHLQRRTTVTAGDIDVKGEVFVTVGRERFLSNEHNKTQLIKLLTVHLKDVGTAVFQAEGDADVPIVQTAIAAAKYGRSSVVVGEDTDLLVLLAALTPVNCNTFMMMPGRSGNQRRVFDITALQQALGENIDLLLFFHAFTGCDTTSAPYMRGKIKSWARLLKCDREQKQALRRFNDKAATHDEIKNIGERFMLHIYNASKNVTSLDELRFETYQRVNSQKSPDAEFQLAVLPPTSAANREHSFRTFHQVQTWLGNVLPATEWGFTEQNGKLRPVTTKRAPAPEELLDVAFCTCPDECGDDCDCRTAGINCCSMCTHCGGTSCDNPASEIISDDDDSDDDPDTA